jgi:hypothetical protein
LILSFCFGFEFSCSFHNFAAFHVFCWLFAVFLLLDDLLELLLAFWSSICPSWGLVFKL